MATKKISELNNIVSAQDTDLLLVETSEGTKSINKGNIIPDTLSDLTDDSTHRLVTDEEKAAWNAKQKKVKIKSITLISNNWGGSDTTYTQVVNIPEVTVNSKIDLQPDSIVLNQLISDGVSALYVENNDGAFTAYAIGAIPTVDLTIQVTVMEVE
jgi:hypothetical protein